MVAIGGVTIATAAKPDNASAQATLPVVMSGLATRAALPSRAAALSTSPRRGEASPA
jgi:hypothetical protein